MGKHKNGFYSWKAQYDLFKGWVLIKDTEQCMSQMVKALKFFVDYSLKFALLHSTNYFWILHK